MVSIRGIIAKLFVVALIVYLFNTGLLERYSPLEAFGIVLTLLLIAGLVGGDI